MNDCGNGSESCCTSLTVNGGTFYRTYTNMGGGPTGEADAATVSTFRLDKYDVTVGRFRQFVAAWNNGAGWTPPDGSGKHAHLNSGNGLLAAGADGATTYESGWLASDDGKIAPTNTNLACNEYSTWTKTAGIGDRLPIDCVDWYEAYAFCIWDGGFLPSVAEWEYAAAGGAQQREYPWGGAAPGTANEYAIYDCYYQGDGPGTCTGTMNIAPVGTASLGAGSWGQLDLVGNVYEWLLDWHPAAGTYVDPCTDCIDGRPSEYRAIRGSNCNDPLIPLSSVNGQPPSNRQIGAAGFRCARTP
jgi:formylglycine-generating enzyme required for sulfatase activity